MTSEFFEFIQSERVLNASHELYRTEDSITFKDPSSLLRTTYRYEKEGTAYMSSLFPGAFFYRQDQLNSENNIASTRFFTVLHTSSSSPVLLSASTIEVFKPLHYVTVHASRKINGVFQAYEAEIVQELKRKMKEWILNTNEYRLSHVTGLIV